MKLRIEEWINERGLKKGYVAQKLGVSEKTLKRWSEGQTDVPLKKAIALAELLRIELNDLWKEEDS